jgi:alpha-N-arabinofuranosidase
VKRFCAIFVAVFFAGFLSVCAIAQQAPPAALTIDASRPTASSSPLLHGLMTEEINYSYDGGLYAELVRNRAMHKDARKGLDGWSAVGSASISDDATTGPSTALPFSLKFVTTAAGTGVANDGFWGVPLRPSTHYQLSFYARSSVSAPLVVSLVRPSTGTVVATTKIAGGGPGWHSYTGELVTSADTVEGSFYQLQITALQSETVWLQLVSLFPPTYKNRVHGFRADLMEKMAAMHPAFLRFPGGNYLEGDHIPERFDWKKTVGPWEDRPTHPSPWHYWSSDGMGLLEFLEWCEDLKIQPLLAVYAGYSMKQEFVKQGPELEPYVQDALDEIEYVSGSVTSKWGAVRAADGHPEPFKLSYVEVGNEDWFDKSGSYEGRYAQFYKAIKSRYPELSLIATMPLRNFRPDVVDDHFYRSEQEFFADVHHYDHTDRLGPKIFVGEWATREGTPTPNFGAALGDAAWMTAMERNSDIVVMHAYAPLFVNVNPGGSQWTPDLIGYDGLNSYGSPAYYAQVLFASHRGNQILSTSLDAKSPLLFESVTQDSTNGKIFVKLVNAGDAVQPVTVKLDGAAKIATSGVLYRLSAKNKLDTNSLGDVHIVPVESEVNGLGVNFQQILPAYSISVYELNTR